MPDTSLLPPRPDHEMADRIQSFDWARTPLGARAGWPASLRAVSELLLAHPLAMIVLWGPELVQLYNDAYRVIMGDKHPGGLGQPTRACWPEVWAFNAPIYAGVLERGETFEFRDQALVIRRHGVDEQAYFTLSFSPVRDELQSIAGVLVTVTETTSRVHAEREAQERQSELDGHSATLAAFAELSRDLTLDTAPYRLIERVQQVVTPLVSATVSQYFEPDGGAWQLRAESRLDGQPRPDPDRPVPGTPSLLRSWQEGVTCYQSGDEGLPDGLTGPGGGGAVPRATVTLPVRVGGVMRGVLGFARAAPGPWSRADHAVLGTVERSLGLALERAEQARQLDEERSALAAFAAFAEEAGSDTELSGLIKRAGKVLGTVFDDVTVAYNELQDGLWHLRAWSDDLDPDLPAVLKRGLPEDTPTFQAVARSRTPLFIDDGDPVREQVGHTAIYRTSAAYPLDFSGSVRATFNVARRRTRSWSERDKAIVRAVGRSLSLVLERAEQARQLDEERAALDAFVAFTETSANATDIHVLARQAVNVLQATLGEVDVLYSELDQGLWKARIWSDGFTPEVTAVLTAGIPVDARSYAEVMRTRDLLLVPGWEAEREGVAFTEAYGAGAFYPCFVGTGPQGLLFMGTRHADSWTAREREVFRAVGRSLALALERADAARDLEARNAELAARTRGLEAFVELSRDLSLQGDPQALIRRAQEVALSLLPEGCALYYEPSGAVWRCSVQVGRLPDPGLQGVVDAGLPFEQPQSLLTPWSSGQPYYQDQYDQDTDQLGPLVERVGATAALPLFVGGQTIGIFAVVLQGEHRWTAIDRAVLETAVRHLGLALEGARAQRELSRTQRFLAVVAENAPLILFATDARGVFTLSEGKLLSKLGLRPGQAVGHAATALYAHEPDLRAGLRLNRALRGEETHDLMHLASNGLTLETWFTPVKNPAGEVTEVVGVSLDVTERLEGQRRLEQANEELRRSNAELEQFAYVASHDLQEPLRSVTTFSQLLASKFAAQDDEKAQRYVRYINEGTERMAQLIQDLLTFSRVTTHVQTLKRVRTRLVLAQVVQDLRDQIERTGTELAVGDLPEVLGDATQLRQLFQNLIGNAIKFREPGRVPVVRVEAVPEGPMRRFSISDNGKGIDPQYFERIFVIFQRLHTREQYEGNGMGLAIVKKIVERHGGQVTLQSVPGEGTTFSFTLPAVPDDL